MEKNLRKNSKLSRNFSFLRAVWENKNYYIHIDYNGGSAWGRCSEAGKIFNNFIKNFNYKTVKFNKFSKILL